MMVSNESKKAYHVLTSDLEENKKTHKQTKTKHPKTTKPWIATGTFIDSMCVLCLFFFYESYLKGH